MSQKEFSRLVRFVTAEGKIVYGDAIDGIGTDSISQAHLIEGDIFGNYKVTNNVVVVSKLLTPIYPENIVCIGLNYRQHAKETGSKLPENPIVFTKSRQSVQNPHDPIIIPTVASDPPEVDYEVELAVVIGKQCKNVSEKDALTYVLGYTCANDVSARKWQSLRGGSQWVFGKSFDTFCPLGPVIVHAKNLDPQAVSLKTTLNGKLVQNSSTSDMIFTVAKLISFLSQSTTLVPGTVILTGTPEGVGAARNPPLFLLPGDSVTIEIEKIGKLTNPVAAEESAKL